MAVQYLAVSAIADGSGGSNEAPSPLSGASFAEVVIAAQGGSTVAFEDLVRQLGRLVYRFLVMRLRSEADARDALQETLIVAWRRLPELRDPRSCRSWLLTIALRKGAEIVKFSRQVGCEAKVKLSKKAETHRAEMFPRRSQVG